MQLDILNFYSTQYDVPLFTFKLNSKSNLLYPNVNPEKVVIIEDVLKKTRWKKLVCFVLFFFFVHSNKKSDSKVDLPLEVLKPNFLIMRCWYKIHGKNLKKHLLAINPIKLLICRCWQVISTKFDSIVVQKPLLRN